MAFVPLSQSADPRPRGFVPLSQNTAGGFVPLENERSGLAETLAPAVKTVKAIGQVYPVAETAANLITQGAALPVAGLAGLGAAATKAAGLTDTEPADVVHSVAGAMTFQPISESGKHLTQAAMTPFEWLAKAGTAAGEKTLEATGSPVAATAVDTAINALPMAVGPLKKAATATKESMIGRPEPSNSPIPDAVPSRGATNAAAPLPEPMRVRENLPAAIAEAEQARGFTPLKETAHALDSRNVPGGIQRLVQDAETVLRPEGQGFQELRGARRDSVPSVAGELPEIPGRRGAETGKGSIDLAGQDRYSGQLRTGERSLGEASAADFAPEVLSSDSLRRPNINDQRGRAGVGVAEGGVTESAVSVSDAAGARFSARQDPVSERFAFGDVQRGNPERSGMGETVGREVVDTPRAASEPASAGTGAPSGKFATEGAEGRGFRPLSETAPPEVRNSFAPGASYAPLIDDSLAANGARSVSNLPDPIRREGIIKDLASAMGTTVYEGRVKGKNRLGFFRPKLEEVRTKRANDLEVAAHELAHLIDDRIPEISQAWKNDKGLAAELRGISYDASKVYEGYAEGVRLWMTQPEALQAKAPKVAAWLDGFAARHEYGPALRKAQAEMTAWFGQDALNRARSKIGEHKPLSEHFDRAFDKFRQATVDDLHGIYQMERQMNGGKIAPVGPYETARLSRASASIADGAVRFGYPVKNADGSFTYRGKGLQEILAPAAERLDDALLYFVGRSARELAQQGREHLFTAGEIRGMLALETPEFRKAFAEYQVWNRKILDFAEAQGVINPEARALWQRTQYLPFHRVSQPGTLKGKPGDWAGIKALTGGTENIKDVLGNMVANAAMLIDVAVKNEARLKVAELAGKPGGGRFMVKIDPEARPVKISGDQVLDAMLERYGIAIDGKAPAFFDFLLQGQPPAGSNVVAVLKGGKPMWYEVGDPILHRALTAIDRPPMHWLTKWLGMPKRVGQMAITLTPDFMLANVARDTIMGSVMSRSGFRPVVDSLQGMRLRMTNDPLYKDYIANGGGLSSLFLDEHHLRTKLEKFYTRQGIDYRTVLDTPDKILSFVETLGDSFEMSTRLGEYKRAIGKGEHPRHAAYQGREVSTDFAMRGDSKALGFLYDTVMFLRPAVVSMDRLFRGVAHDPNKAAIGAKTAMLALSSVGLYLLNRDDPRYADLPDWDRDANWHFFVGDQHFRYPKIWEIGAVASAAER
nr:hypothetical protein [Propionivibrio sp.]